MSIETEPGRKPLVGPAPPSWGELAVEGRAAIVVRFILDQSAVTIPVGLFRRWEHSLGLPETITLVTDRERVVVEGKELAPIRVALDLGRLCELRVNYHAKPGVRPGPQVRRILIEPA